MENIYGQTESARNSIVSLPDGFASDAGNTLYSWLGSLWRNLHKGDDLVKGLQEVRGIRLAQLYINILEAAKLQDRFGAPVFHKELWHPIIVRRSLRNKSQENMLILEKDDEKVIGPQEDELYGKGTEFKIGRMANFASYVTYPINVKIAGGATTIVDNIINPTVVLKNGTNFEIRNDSIIFYAENDPLGDNSPFEKYDLPDIIDEEADVEAVLWASDVLIDKNYISDHISYALGANTSSTDVVKRILNAAWSSVTCGLTPELIKTLLAAMMNVPVIQNDEETVVDIETEFDSDGKEFSKIVHTDKSSYRISLKAQIRSNVKVGSVLKRGDLLDETVRIYPFLNVDSAYNTEYQTATLEEDVPTVVLSPSLIRAKTTYGVYAMWGESKVKQMDNDPEHLYFDIGGTESDVNAFWKDIWDNAEQSGVSMKTILGEVGSSVSPAKFLLKNLVGANTLFVVIDKSQADDMSMVRSPMFFDMLSSVIPSGIRLFLIEHDNVEDKKTLGGCGETTFLAAALPEISDSVVMSDTMCALDRSPSFAEDVSIRLIRPAPQKAKGRKEEEQ